jgi:hypothetical protein
MAITNEPFTCYGSPHHRISVKAMPGGSGSVLPPNADRRLGAIRRISAPFAPNPSAL